MECQLEALRKCLTVYSVRHALRNLPPTLDATYERILINIPQEYRREAHCALQLLTVSYRPLKLHEMAEAVAIDPETGIFDPENRLRDPEALLEICSSLLILSGYVIHLTFINCSRDELRFAHYSVHEHLVSGRTSQRTLYNFGTVEREAHQLFVRLSMIYLPSFIKTDASLVNAFADGDGVAMDHIEEMFPFLEYTSMFWPEHLHDADIGNFPPPEFMLTKQLFDPTFHFKFYQIWSRVMQRHGDDEGGGGFSSDDSITTQAAYRLYHASFLGLTELVRWLLHEGADPNVPSGAGYGYALIAAVAVGNEAIVILLLDLGADIEASWCGNKALHIAAKHDNEALLRVLLDRGARIDGPGPGETALWCGVGFRNYSAIRLLIERGAEVNALGGNDEYPLYMAAVVGDETMVQLLLENGALVNAKSGECGYALQTAARWGRIETVRLLLGKGAGVNAEGGRFGCALQAAATCSSQEAGMQIAQLLLDNGANVNLTGGEYGSALGAARERGHILMVDLLLKSRAGA